MKQSTCTLLVAFALSVAGSTSAYAQGPANAPRVSSAQLSAFARSNAQKFSTEVVSSSEIPVGTPFRTRVELSALNFTEIGADYDLDTGELVATFTVATFGKLLAASSCKPAGSFTGQNAYGAKATIRRQRCEVVYLADGDVTQPRVAGARAKMTPAQFRNITANGSWADIEFSIGHTRQKQTVTFREFIEEGTIRDPVQYEVREWVVYGEITRIDLLPTQTGPAIPFWSRQR